MADQRKSFRPRRLAFGGRLVPHALVLAAGFAFCVALMPAVGQEAGLKNGAASLAAGKYDAAVRQLSATINSDNASRNDAAQALYLRGIAYRKLGEPARAVSDLGAAIWLGLPANDRVKALVNRGLAYQAAGLSKEGAAEIAAARKIGGSREVDQLIAEGGGAPPSAAAIAAFSTEVRPESGSASSTPPPEETSTSFSTSVRGTPAPPSTRTADASPGSWSTSVSDDSRPATSSSGNRLTRWFGSLTDSSGSPPATQPAPQPSPASAPPAAKPSRPAPQPAAAQAPSTGWSTEIQQTSAGTSGGGESSSRWSRLFNRTAGSDPQVQPAPAPAASGAYKLQLTTSRSEAEAKALWKKVSQTQSLGGIQPEIERVEIGDFGTFYALRIGPFPDKSESLRVCNALKRSGIDCSPAEQ